jgi:glycosyltransferase involved in cell wall biosynthesis
MTPKRLCMIGYTNYVTDGRIRMEAESLVRWGNEVIMFVPRVSAIPRKETVCGVEVRELNAQKYQGSSTFLYIASYFVFLAKSFLAVTWLFFRSHIDAVHVHNMPDFLVFAALVPRMFGRKLILDIHDTVPETFMSKFQSRRGVMGFLLRLEESVSCRLAHRIVLVNHVQRQALVERGIPAEKMVTLLSIPKIVAEPRAASNANGSQTFRLVNHGTIATRLGNDLIIEAAAKLASWIDGFELHIIGAGDALNEVIARSKSLGLDGKVHFHPLVPLETLFEQLRSMDVGIVGNRRDIATELMLPVKLIDYVALGIPAVVPRLKGIEYYFSDDMVSYFESENVDSMVEAVMRVYRDEARRALQPMRAKVFLEKYGWDMNQASLRSLYEICLEPEPRQGLLKERA